LPGEERRGDHGDNNKGVVQNYESERERERTREREKRRDSGVTKRVRTPRHIAMSRAHQKFWLLSFCLCFFFIIFVTPLNGWKGEVCVGVEKDKVI
jgi:hypothetical protein